MIQRLKLMHFLLGVVSLMCQESSAGERMLHPNFSRGTLIVCIPTASGLLIAADKRSIYQVANKESVTDTSNKLNPVGSSTVVVTTGWSELWDVQAPEEMRLNVTSVVSLYLMNQIEVISLQDHKIEIGTLLKNCFEEFLKRKKMVVPKFKRGPNESLFITTIFHYNKVRRSFERLSIMLQCLSESGAELTPLINDKPPGGNFNLAKATCLGETGIVDAIACGTDPRFAELRKTPYVRQFVLQPQSAQVVPKEAATEAAANLINDTNRFCGLMKKVVPTVGTTMDVVLLGPNKLDYVQNKRCADVIAARGIVFGSESGILSGTK